MCQLHTAAFIALLAPEKTTTTPLATQKRPPPGIYYTWYLSLRIYMQARCKSIREKKRKEKKRQRRKKRGIPIDLINE